MEPSTHRRGIGCGSLVAGVILALLVVVGLHAYAVIGAVAQVRGVQQDLVELQVAAMSLNFDTATAEAQSIDRRFEKIESSLKWAFLAPAVPVVSDYYASGLGVARAGGHLSDALLEAMTVAEDVTATLSASEVEDIKSFNDLSGDERLQLLRAFRNHGDSLRKMQTSLHLAKNELDGVKERVPPLLIEALGPIERGIDSVIDAVDLFAPLSLSLNEIAGVEEPKTWMALFLNNNELRPAGGFMGVFGLATVHRAEIESLALSDTYSLDQPLETNSKYTVPAPTPIQTYLGVQKWYFRDTNWSPDFATSAQFSQSIFTQATQSLGQTAPPVDGVVGFTLSVAEDVLEVTGPVEIDGIVFDSENIRDALQFEVSFGYEGRGLEKAERKEIVGALTTEVFNRLIELPITKWPELFEVIRRNVAEGQIAIYSNNEQAQKLFVDQGWAGVIEYKEGQDLLMVVDSNMHALKTDPYIDRKTTYTITPTGKSTYSGTVTSTYTHTGNFTLTESRYRNYVRLYAPLGTRLTSYEGFMLNDKVNDPAGTPGIVTIEEENGMQVFGGFVAIEPGESKTISWTFDLAPTVTETINAGSYTLIAPKQLGSFAKPLYLDLSFNAKVKTAIPAELPSHFGDKGYTLDATQGSNQKFIVEL